MVSNTVLIFQLPLLVLSSSWPWPQLSPEKRRPPQSKSRRLVRLGPCIARPLLIPRFLLWYLFPAAPPCGAAVLSVYLVFCFYVFSYDRGIIHRSSKKKRVAKYLENIPAYRAFMSKPSPKARLKENTSEWRLLKFLNDLAYGFLDLSLPRAYHSRTALLRAFFGLDNRSAKFSASDWEKHKKLFSATLTRLRQKGYVVLERKGNRFLWKASKTGKNLFNFNCPENMLLP